MNHEKIIADYETGKGVLAYDVRNLLNNMSSDEAEAKTGKSYSYLWSIRTGKRQYVTYEQYLNLYNLLKSS
jgi:hypothetical protein